MAPSAATVAAAEADDTTLMMERLVTKETVYMSASLNVDCGKKKYTDEYTEIFITATISLIAIPSLILLVFYFFIIRPAVPYIEARRKRFGVSPLVDFLVEKWKPSKWHFAFIDMVRI